MTVSDERRMTIHPPAFIAENMSFHYGAGAQATLALKDVNLAVSEGEFVSIVGPSGCGKSTLLRIAANLMAPSTGAWRAVREGQHGDGGRVGMMFQQPVLMPWRSVLANITMINDLADRRVSRDKIQTRAGELLELVGLGAFADKYPFELSGGMQQRAALARSLLLDPDLLLLDEPFGALDALTRETLNEELQRVWMTQRPTVLLVTHDIDEATFLSDRVIVMSRRPGRVLREIRVDIPRPRTDACRYTDEFLDVHREAKNLLAH